jgi:hypothetical protein
MDLNKLSDRWDQGLRAIPRDDADTVAQVAADTFGKWLRQLKKRAKTVVGATVAIPGLTFLFGLFAKQLNAHITLHLDRIVALGFCVQFVAVFCLYWFIPRHPYVDEAAEGSHGDALPRAARAAKRFGDLWSYTWLCWAVVYFGFALSAQYQLWYPKAKLWYTDPINDFLNNIQTIFFLMCYRELRYPTDEERRNPLFALLSVPVFLVIVELVLLLPDNPAHSSLGEPLRVFLSWATGFAGGAAIALLVGRLESKFIDPPSWLTYLLYVYAAIQGAHIVLNKDLYATLVLTSFAFFSKVVFFLFIAWILQSGVLLYYFTEIKRIHLDAPTERRTFLARLARKEH